MLPNKTTDQVGVKYRSKDFSKEQFAELMSKVLISCHQIIQNQNIFEGYGFENWENFEKQINYRPGKLNERLYFPKLKITSPSPAVFVIISYYCDREGKRPGLVFLCVCKRILPLVNHYNYKKIIGGII